MYLHKSERKGGTYLSIVEGYREGGKVKHRTVESLGYVDDLMCFSQENFLGTHGLFVSGLTA